MEIFHIYSNMVISVECYKNSQKVVDEIGAGKSLDLVERPNTL